MHGRFARGRLPAQRAAIEQRRGACEARWRQRIANWERHVAPLRGQSVAAQHTTFGYLWPWLGMTQAADLEPRPGMAPTPGHLQRLLQGLREAPPPAVVTPGFQDPRPGRWLTGQLGAKVPLVVLPATVPEDAAEKLLVKWLDGLLRELLQRMPR